MTATSPTGPTGFSREDLIRALPYARRYGRALTGSQSEGDALVAASLRDMGITSWSARYSLYEAVSRRFNGGRHSLTISQGVAIEAMTTTDLDIFQRELLLLTALEGIKLEDAAKMLELSDENATELLDSARQRLRSAASTDVLIIEDEPIIAMDIEGLVESCGHRVVGVASSETEAVQIATRTQPGLILADINLGIGGDGASAVARILRRHQTPVIFVTAYPERLLTGAGSEPAFVITKPFEPLTLAIATYQAVTGGVVLG